MKRIAQPLVVVVAATVIALLAAGGGCGGGHSSSGFNSSASSGGGGGSGGSGGGGSSAAGGSSGASGGLNLGSSGSSSGGAPACASGQTGWRCKVNTTCSTPTELTGKVYDPAKKNPLYDVVVFIPNDVSTLPKITQGTHTCNTCDVSIGNYVVATTTDAKGQFKLTGVPTAKQVPVTVQIGKWRRTTYIDINSDCATNAAPDKSLHLPGSKAEGDMPQMALLTGGCDDMACFLMNMGIASSEFGAPHANGRVDVYQGNSMPLGVGGPGPALSNGTAGNCTNTSCPLWASKASFEAYDMAIFSCQCSEQAGISESPAGYTNLHDWLNEGGKVFASHYHYTWFANNPDPAWKATATWLGGSVAAGMGTDDIDTSFPKGMIFSQWLGNVGALAGNGPPPTISLSSIATSVSTVNNATTQRWIYDPATSPNDTKYLSFGTPIGGAPRPDGGTEMGKLYCGKAVFTDLHTSSGLFASAMNVPADCMAADLTPQQKALEFLFFDLAACVTDDTKPPPPPPPPPPQ
jgi:hypothetical protein